MQNTRHRWRIRYILYDQHNDPLLTKENIISYIPGKSMPHFFFESRNEEYKNHKFFAGEIETKHDKTDLVPEPRFIIHLNGGKTLPEKVEIITLGMFRELIKSGWKKYGRTIKNDRSKKLADEIIDKLDKYDVPPPFGFINLLTSDDLTRVISKIEQTKSLQNKSKQ